MAFNNNNITEPEIKDTLILKRLKIKETNKSKACKIKIKRTKGSRKPNVLRALLIGLLFGLLAGSFVAYDKYKKVIKSRKYVIFKFQN